ncbi:MAG: hypothetical protein DSO07_08235 [Thermoproteota archaeon]|jgi:hypothetical protein|uniref:Uncharacterized protein n=1 Tax=Candidatus Methanodesulfokora washburnensis TaxID=2478471 RepID=A0A3R9RKW1_9CREN|nr:hypothetical protein [Candidatus Methanodesulfokores washburnensis]RSN72537.1 hypothetical protein D6D85_13475 [Candidatus Methanodesulfokores washburnensis]TDA40741.1 MAG: hypothetical protein DSO07_08235 [Candidatus Korarchaeota archaeon]
MEEVKVEKKRMSKNGYLALGIVSAIVALLILPPVFGIISIFCGVQLYRKFDEGLGLAIIILGGACLVIGVIIGILTTISLWYPSP